MSTFHLNLSLMTPGHFRGAWRLPDRDPLAWIDVARYRELARQAEAARIHALFLGDSPGLGRAIAEHPEAGLDPTVLFSHVLAGTRGLGAIATASSTYNSPYNLARRYLALDHVTGGRAAFNVVTTFSPNAAAAFGYDRTPEKSERYRRADEFVRAVLSLWDGWDDDAIVGDRTSGRFADPGRIHRTELHGKSVRLEGALSVPPSPQRRPVLVQAGGSPGGLALAARYADVVFTVGQTLGDAVAFRDGTRERAAAGGRDPGQVAISLGVVVLVAATEREARARVEELVDASDPVEAAHGVARQLGLDPAAITPDTVLTPDVLDAAPDPPGSAGFHRSIRALLSEHPLTVRELFIRSASGSGHRLLVGTPEQIADDLEQWHGAGAADGFTIMPADTAVDFGRFTESVVPILQRRGLFHRDYEADTLRGNLGLAPLAPGHDRALATREPSALPA
ncbi:NtaA/DmoA family FMN-dependent monooxygenase [Microbacterium betulae]|uniref:NtaA/DmoA family FMN-dependent monooxygenase n=1 Tax=Microbacterium betulae TaxID=2981139 RepID=A0AA97FJ86_9MICO|nr:NtaA/DmoA family FMN-dependent monooxygenase [Microbacterium sp. AB]WOF23285.1 NtaA/DmoA family FMN-dependent monooxygenase [Microbacterium sp. AB]